MGKSKWPKWVIFSFIYKYIDIYIWFRGAKKHRNQRCIKYSASSKGFDLQEKTSMFLHLWKPGFEIARFFKKWFVSRHWVWHWWKNSILLCDKPKTNWDNLLHGQPHFFHEVFWFEWTNLFFAQVVFSWPKQLWSWNSVEISRVLEPNSSLHVCAQSLMRKVFCEMTSCLCAIPDVQGVLWNHFMFVCNPRPVRLAGVEGLLKGGGCLNGRRLLAAWRVALVFCYCRDS